MKSKSAQACSNDVWAVVEGRSPKGDIIVAQDVSPGLTLLGGRSPAGRHTGFDVVGEEVPSLKGLGDLITRFPSAEPALSGVEGCWATIVTPFGLAACGETLDACPK